MKLLNILLIIILLGCIVYYIRINLDKNQNLIYLNNMFMNTKNNISDYSINVYNNYISKSNNSTEQHKSEEEQTKITKQTKSEEEQIQIPEQSQIKNSDIHPWDNYISCKIDEDIFNKQTMLDGSVYQFKPNVILY